MKPLVGTNTRGLDVISRFIPSRGQHSGSTCGQVDDASHILQLSVKSYDWSSLMGRESIQSWVLNGCSSFTVTSFTPLSRNPASAGGYRHCDWLMAVMLQCTTMWRSNRRPTFGSRPCFTSQVFNCTLAQLRLNTATRCDTYWRMGTTNTQIHTHHYIFTVTK